MKLYYMNDNHTFRELPRDVEDAITAIREQFACGQTHGMLCATHNGQSNASPFDERAYVHGRGDFDEFEPRAREWLTRQIAYRSPADREYESWLSAAPSRCSMQAVQVKDAA